MALSQRHILALMLAFVNAASQIIIKFMDLHTDYNSPKLLTTDIGGSLIRYYSKPGLPDWDSIPPAVSLLAENADPAPQDCVWCVNCGTGALTVAMAKMVPLGSSSLITYDTLAINCANLTFLENNLGTIKIITDIDLSNPDLEQPDLILYNIYKGRNLNRRLILNIWKVLKPGGRLLISGANNQGIQSSIKDAIQLFQNYGVLAYKKGNRVVKFIKEDHLPMDMPDWTHQFGISPGTWQTFNVNICGFSFDLVSLPGVFSHGRLDEGTALLLSTLNDLSGKKVLDVGCGYGIIGLFTAAGNAKVVDMVDSNLLAVACTRENILRNNYPVCRVYGSDLLCAVSSSSYDYILSNPPFHAGLQVDYHAAHALITHARHLLEPGGLIQVVANRFIPYDRLMSDEFGNVKVLHQTSAYRILASQKVH